LSHKTKALLGNSTLKHSANIIPAVEQNDGVNMGNVPVPGTECSKAVPASQDEMFFNGYIVKSIAGSEGTYSCWASFITITHTHPLVSITFSDII